MTKINQLLTKLQNNWKQKIFCLVIAIILYICHQIYSIDKKSFIIPLNIIENGSVMHVENVKSTVTVSIRADSDIITLIHPTDIEASITLDTIPKTGEYSVPVNLSINSDLLSNDPFEVTVKPESIKVKVERKDIKNIMIAPTIGGEPRHGYEVTDIEVDPPYIEVLGPETLLKNTETIHTETIDVTDAKNTIKTTVVANNISNQLKLTNEGPYNVTVKVEPQKMERTFEKVQISPFGLTSNLKVKGNLPVTDIVVSGPVPTLEEYELPINAMQMDLSLITEPGKYEVAVTGNLPAYLNLESQSVEIATIEVERATSNFVVMPDLSIGE